MVNAQLIKPQSIAVIGGSDNTFKPGGKVLENLIKGGFKNLFVVNPKSDLVQGIKSYKDLNSLPQIDLGILAIPAKFCYPAIEQMSKNGTNAFIILSAGFGELNEEGKEIENKLIQFAKQNKLSILGPNCIGIINEQYKGAFTTPIPPFNPKGVDFISSSGSTAVFVMEAGMKMGMQFSSVYSVGNAIQIQVEDILEQFDNDFIEGQSSKVIMIYIEQISDPEKLLTHSRSLINKGCSIVGIKAGLTAAGGRAASSHTGAMASPEVFVKALFKKAGIIQCDSREEMLYTAGVLFYGKPIGENIAIITHAGGAGVMCADALESSNMNVPIIAGKKAIELLSKLHTGSSVTNPIDFLATGSAEQLGEIIDYCNIEFDNIDAQIVIFGSPGLFDVDPVYNLLSDKIDSSTKPIYPVLPSPVNTENAIKSFVDKGKIFFPDEVILAKAISKVYFTPPLYPVKKKLLEGNIDKLNDIISNSNSKYLKPEEVSSFLSFAGINQVKEFVVSNEVNLLKSIEATEFPLVMKVVGPIHKTDVNGVVLNIDSIEKAKKTFSNLMNIKDANAVLIQPMLRGIELFVGAKREGESNHILMAGMGGIYLETIKDIRSALTPIGDQEAQSIIESLNSYPILKGTRGEKGIDITKFKEIIKKLSDLLNTFSQISEIDINPLIANENTVCAVDCRIKIEY